MKIAQNPSFADLAVANRKIKSQFFCIDQPDHRLAAYL